jgi:hypothetical protein
MCHETQALTAFSFLTWITRSSCLLHDPLVHQIDCPVFVSVIQSSHIAWPSSFSSFARSPVATIMCGPATLLRQISPRRDQTPTRLQTLRPRLPHLLTTLPSLAASNIPHRINNICLPSPFTNRRQVLMPRSNFARVLAIFLEVFPFVFVTICHVKYLRCHHTQLPFFNRMDCSFLLSNL